MNQILGIGMYVLPLQPKMVSRSSKLPLKWVQKAHFLGIKTSEPDATYLSQSNAEIKNAWSHTSIP